MHCITHRTLCLVNPTYGNDAAAVEHFPWQRFNGWSMGSKLMSMIIIQDHHKPIQHTGIIFALLQLSNQPQHPTALLIHWVPKVSAQGLKLVSVTFPFKCWWTSSQ